MSPSSSAVASEPLAWPSYWPALPLPLTIELPKLAVRDLRIQRDDAEPQTITAIDGGLRIASDQVRITALTITHALDTVRIDGRKTGRASCRERVCQYG